MERYDFSESKDHIFSLVPNPSGRYFRYEDVEPLRELLASAIGRLKGHDGGYWDKEFIARAEQHLYSDQARGVTG